MKKSFALLLVCMLAVSSLFAQGGKETQASPKEVVITFSTNVVGAKAEALKAACEAFEAETGYVVDFQAPGSSYEELMKTKMSANELPDVFTTHGWSVARYSPYLMPINDQPFASRISNQIKGVITDADGNMYVLPVDIDVAGIVYNETVLAQAGVDVDSIKTWDDFAKACDAVLASGKNPVHIGGKDGWTIGQFFDWAAPSFFVTDEANSHAAELKAGTFDKAVWAQVAGLLDSWVQKGYLNVDCLTSNYNSDIAAIANDKTAFVFYGNSSFVDAKKANPNAQLGVMPIPSASASDEPSLIAGEDIAVGIWKDTKVKAQALELLNYLARPEVCKALAESAGAAAGLTDVQAEVGEISKYLEKNKDVQTFPYFDREYLPSGMWDVMCTTGADILAQNKNAISNAAEIMATSFADKY